MCFLHIMNICVQHVIDEFSNPNLVVIVRDYTNGLDGNSMDKDFCLNAIKKNPVSVRLDIICVIHALCI